MAVRGVSVRVCVCTYVRGCEGSVCVDVCVHVCGLPIAVANPVPITTPRALPAATLVPEKRMFFLS